MITITDVVSLYYVLEPFRCSILGTDLHWQQQRCVLTITVFPTNSNLGLSLMRQSQIAVIHIIWAKWTIIRIFLGWWTKVIYEGKDEDALVSKAASFYKVSFRCNSSLEVSNRRFNSNNSHSSQDKWLMYPMNCVYWLFYFCSTYFAPLSAKHKR